MIALVVWLAVACFYVWAALVVLALVGWLLMLPLWLLMGCPKGGAK